MAAGFPQIRNRQCIRERERVVDPSVIPVRTIGPMFGLTI